jgi:hypothetical protein
MEDNIKMGSSVLDWEVVNGTEMTMAGFDTGVV